MTKKKKIIIASSAIILIALISIILVIALKKDDDGIGTAYVTSVSECNTATAFSISSNRFAGVVEAQKAEEIKVDSDKTIKEILVKEGDNVEEGTELFKYDVESMKLELEEGQIEIERMENDISSYNKQIKDLENEKKNAGADAQVSYTTQIQALQTDIAKTEYDIKVKKVSLEKIKNSIENSAVKSPSAGTVKSLKKIEELQESGTDVIMTITASGNFRIKGKFNEQNMGTITQGQAVLIKSRLDDTITWNGLVSEVSNEPETNNNNNGMIMEGGSDNEMTSSNYAFFIDPENTDGLVLGQHVLIEVDYGQSSSIEKSGIWLYSDYIVDFETEKPYVWASDKDKKLEKRYIKTGQTDEINGDCEILSGLKESDYIAYPSDDLTEGMKTTTNIDDIENSGDNPVGVPGDNNVADPGIGGIDIEDGFNVPDADVKDENADGADFVDGADSAVNEITE